MVDPKTEASPFSNQGWLAKFRFALRGVFLGIKGPSGSVGQNSFLVHLPCSIIVIAAAIWMRLDWVSLAILLTCIGMVFVAELINSSIEALAKAVTVDHDSNIETALDIAAGSAFVASLTAVVVGGLIFVPKIISMLGW